MRLADDREPVGASTARERVAAEMARAAVAEFIGMERSLRAAAAHLAAAEGIRGGDDAGTSGITTVAPGLAAMVQRVTFVAKC